jgi:D-xylose transport system substrate-binding protein
VGEIQAGYLLRKAPAGNYVLIGGPPEDGNARLYREGQRKALRPYLDRGEIRIVADQPAKGWFPMEALKITREALDKTDGRISAVVASNDGTAGGAIQALEGRGLAGKVTVSGQDADLAACQRIARGTQSMTVYKPVQLLAVRAAEAAVALGRKEPLGGGGRTVPNGRKDVPSLLFEPILVDRKNLADTVIADGFHGEKEIFG